MSSTKELILLFLCGSHNQYGHCGRGKMHIKLTTVKKSAGQWFTKKMCQENPRMPMCIMI